MTEPLDNRPKITTNDIQAGFITRYFLQNISTMRIVEVDKKQYDVFRRNSQYKALQIKWIITGNANITVTSNNRIVYGAQYKNFITIRNNERNMPGLSRTLRNPLEYFQGVDNRIQ